MNLPSIYWREKHATLISHIVDLVMAQIQPRAELHGEFDGEEPANVKRCIDELIAFGAIRQRGKYSGPGKDTRVLEMTELGRAWIDQANIPPLVDAPRDEIVEYWTEPVPD